MRPITNGEMRSPTEGALRLITNGVMHSSHQDVMMRSPLTDESGMSMVQSPCSEGRISPSHTHQSDGSSPREPCSTANTHTPIHTPGITNIIPTPASGHSGPVYSSAKLDRPYQVSEHYTLRELTSPHPMSDMMRHPAISRSLSADHAMSHSRPSLTSLIPQLSSSLCSPSVSASLVPSSHHVQHMTLPHTPIPSLAHSQYHHHPHHRPTLPPLPPFHSGIVQQRRGSVPMDHEEIVSALQCLADSMPMS